jgi:chitooligosaccharide deacetylase
LVLGGGACLLAAGHLGTQGRPVRQGTADRVVKLRGIDPRAVSAVPADTSLVSLTFDDEPDPAHTPAVLAILERFDVRATFFMIGRAAAQHPDLVRAVIAGGHTVANHTQDHLWLDRLDEQGVTQQVTRCSSTFTRLALPVTTLFRPPRGLPSPTVAAVTAAVEPRAYFWGTCLEANLRNLSPDGEASATACRFHPGQSSSHPTVVTSTARTLSRSIDRSPTVAALPALIQQTRARGLGCATPPDLIAARRRG